MKSIRLMMVVVLALLLMAAMAQAKPNFSGDWKMNASKSDFGAMPAPSSMVQKITHNDPSLKVLTTQTSDRGELTTDFTFTTDGKDCVNQVRNFELKSTVKWDGDVLVIDSKMDFQGNAATMSEKWSLSEDGKVLTISRHFVSPMGEGDAKTVLEKQ